MLIDAAIGWVQAHCPDPKLRADLKRKLKDAMQLQSDCWFGIGPVLTRDRAPYLIHCYAGELFIFQLTLEQARAILPAPSALGSSIAEGTPGLNRRAEKILVSISNMELDQPVLTPRDRVTGSIRYEVQGDAPARYCLRLDYQLGLPRDVDWNRPEQILSNSGCIRFSFKRLADSDSLFARDYRGPLALFLRICTDSASDELSGRRPISNACGTLVDCV